MTHPLPLAPRPGWLPRTILRIQQAVEGWRERVALQRELTNLSQRGELERTLADTGISPSETDRLMHAHPGSAHQLAEMMSRVGVDRSRLPLSTGVGAALREIEWTCGECTDWRECRAWLSSGLPKDGYRSFCPNAAALEQLRAQQAATAPAGETGAEAGTASGLRAATK